MELLEAFSIVRCEFHSLRRSLLLYILDFNVIIKLLILFGESYTFENILEILFH